VRHVEAEAFAMPAVGGQVPPLFAALEPPAGAADDSDEVVLVAELPACAGQAREPAAELC
jgi:hypothetical protein